MTARGTLVALLLPLALLSACGDDSDSAAADPVGSDSPQRDRHHVADRADGRGDRLPHRRRPPGRPAPTPGSPTPSFPFAYKGCLDGDQAVEADNLSCSSGQRIVRYDDSFYAVAGGKIHQASGPLEKDKEYLKLVRVCRA